jgi:hypothetical protein
MDNNKMSLKETGMDGEVSIQLAQDSEGRLFTW